MHTTSPGPPPAPRTAPHAVGAYGERVAARYLVEQGMTILARNWRCSDGEIDIVAKDGPVVVFCEVKTRTSDRFGAPAEAITHRKTIRMRRCAVQWLMMIRRHAPEIRFDVISVWPQFAGAARVEHLQGAF